MPRGISPYKGTYSVHRPAMKELVPYAKKLRNRKLNWGGDTLGEQIHRVISKKKALSKKKASKK